METENGFSQFASFFQTHPLKTREFIPIKNLNLILHARFGIINLQFHGKIFLSRKKLLKNEKK